MTETALVDITLVDVGEGISEAQIVEWLIAVGQKVSEDQSVVSISTDKITLELPAPVSGVLRQQLVQVGVIVPVGTVLARIEPKQKDDRVLPSPAGESFCALPKKKGQR
jgi:pyruvate/2-oxoglutarate dehydrogenase complex dihydrolipoamide acyltransferase (E2) component